MFTERKYKILVWLVIVLVVLNISTIGSIIWHVNHRPVGNIPLPNQPLPEDVRGGFHLRQYLDNELQFNEEQVEAFNKYHDEFRFEAHQVAIHMAQVRDEMMTELMSNQPNEERLEQLSAEIGDDHRDLKILTSRFFINLKKVCTPEQTIKLGKFFRTIMQTEPPEGPGGRGDRMMQRKGKRGMKPKWDTDTIH